MKSSTAFAKKNHYCDCSKDRFRIERDRKGTDHTIVQGSKLFGSFFRLRENERCMQNNRQCDVNERNPFRSFSFANVRTVQSYVQFRSSTPKTEQRNGRHGSVDLYNRYSYPPVTVCARLCIGISKTQLPLPGQNIIVTVIGMDFGQEGAVLCQILQISNMPSSNCY